MSPLISVKCERSERRLRVGGAGVPKGQGCKGKGYRPVEADSGLAVRRAAAFLVRSE